jgi:hypothetical protein
MADRYNVPVAYITNLATALTHELTKFGSYRRYQLAGHVANLDFWLAEARHVLAVIDGYPARLDRHSEAHTQYVLEHKVVEFDPKDPSGVNLGLTLPKRTSEAELRRSRDELCTALYRFLVRCCNKGFIDEDLLRRECKSFGIGVVDSDLKKR